jgi:hypothetical protein
MDKKNNQIAHRRIVAGSEILRKYGQNNNSPATGWQRDLVEFSTRLRSRTSPLVIATFFRTPDLAVLIKIPLVPPQGYEVTAIGSR